MASISFSVRWAFEVHWLRTFQFGVASSSTVKLGDVMSSIVLFLYQICLILFQATDEASGVHIYTNVTDFWAEMWMSSWSRLVVLKAGRTEWRNDGMTEFENPQSPKAEQRYHINLQKNVGKQNKKGTKTYRDNSPSFHRLLPLIC